MYVKKFKKIGYLLLLLSSQTKDCVVPLFIQRIGTIHVALIGKNFKIQLIFTHENINNKPILNMIIK